METGLAGKRVLVTGASGGIGAACARAFAAEGSRVALHYNQGKERAQALAAELPDAAVVQGDLSSEEEADRVFASCRESLGGLDVCVAVAGAWPEEDVPAWKLSLERWEKTLRANLTLTFLTARGFLREVERNGHGSLVLIGSTAGRTTRRRSPRSCAGSFSASRTRLSGWRRGDASTRSVQGGRCRR
jgi:3-oxoacyl-[acyl-carrier protein] reductase